MDTDDFVGGEFSRYIPKQVLENKASSSSAVPKASATPELSIAERGWVNLSELAEMLGVSLPSIARWRRKGLFKATWYISGWRIEGDEALRFKHERNKKRITPEDLTPNVRKAIKEGRVTGCLPSTKKSALLALAGPQAPINAITRFTRKRYSK